MNIKDELKQARIKLEQEMVQTLLKRKDLSYEQIGDEFGVSVWFVDQIVKKYNLKGSRKSGPKKQGA